MTHLGDMVDVLHQYSLTPSDTVETYRPRRLLSVDERVYGLVQFWTEVKYNFAFFDQVPDLNWDGKLQEYLPLVRAAPDDNAYYRLLQRLCAELQDGHTNIYPPMYVRGTFVAPPVSIAAVGDAFIVENVDSTLQERLPLGSEVVAIDDQPVEAYLRDSIYPYVAAGSDHVRRMIAARELLNGPLGTPVRLAVRTPEGASRAIDLPRNRQTGPYAWVKDRPRREPAAFRKLPDGVGYMQFNTFSEEAVVDSFHRYRPALDSCSSLVIDLRYNGGGNSGIGYEILRHFLTGPVPTSAWRTREHRAAFKAWGDYYIKSDRVTDDEWTQRAVKTYRGDYWYEGESDTLTPADTVYRMPVVVLVSHQTASAAEDFLVAADAAPEFTFVGEASYGSTGQPLWFKLPGGGDARVCTKRDTYADGREFVGPGVQVDVPVELTVADYLSNRDVVLERALEVLGSKR